MKELFVLAEHRQGELRDVTFEMLTKGREISQKINADLTAVLLGHDVKEFAKTLAEQAKKVLIIDDVRLENFNAETYQKVLSYLISERQPSLTLIGHTAFGVDLAPSLATELKMPLATDCIDLDFEGERLVVIRQVYGGKVNVKAMLRKSESYIVTLRPATFEAQEVKAAGGQMIEVASPLSEDITYKRFIEYVQPPAGEVDITAADVIVAIGRGIKDADNMPVIEKLAKALGGVLACSRPIVDKDWLPTDRQVGTSGKTVKPKLYIAVGISGAFQHISGMKNADLIIAVNKDGKAPIFRVADYGVVEDLFKVVPVLTERILEEKSS
ncbi:MAG: electron transfer flavoprotein subunit alpha/FixB family protein [Candidatus Bathyarchaeota archaeon]|nr:electron transfer flavoprotein subunit alpha/FixB family protein [Candidatus Bathyarchaeota archaeon]MDH5733744.1 electron transfer flavoprotein subunit alpha/FixB family protein [Candidatus Bathyarchaeota archaeon]